MWKLRWEKQKPGPEGVVGSLLVAVWLQLVPQQGH